MPIRSIPRPCFGIPTSIPEGAVEKFKYTVGDVDFFATLAQFLYADDKYRNESAPSLPSLPSGQHSSIPFLLAWQGGFIYHVNKSISLKAAVTLYNYDGVGKDNNAQIAGPAQGPRTAQHPNNPRLF